MIKLYQRFRSGTYHSLMVDNDVVVESWASSPYTAVASLVGQYAGPGSFVYDKSNGFALVNSWDTMAEYEKWTLLKDEQNR